MCYRNNKWGVKSRKVKNRRKWNFVAPKINFSFFLVSTPVPSVLICTLISASLQNVPDLQLIDIHPHFHTTSHNNPPTPRGGEISSCYSKRGSSHNELGELSGNEPRCFKKNGAAAPDITALKVVLKPLKMKTGPKGTIDTRASDQNHGT